jgi:hypothetical protein
MEAMQIIKFLEEAFPNSLPRVEVDRFELGVLIGEQKVLNILKQKLQILDNINK